MTEAATAPRFFVLLAQTRTGSTFAGQQLDTHPHIECYGALFGRLDTVWNLAAPSSKIGRLKASLGPRYDDLDYRHEHWKEVLEAAARIPTVHSSAIRQTLLKSHKIDERTRIAKLPKRQRSAAKAAIGKSFSIAQPSWYGFKHMMTSRRAGKDRALESIAADPSIRALMLLRANCLASYSSEKIVRVTGQAHAHDKVEKAKAQFDVDEFDHYWRTRERLIEHWKAKFEPYEGRLCELEYNRLRGSAGTDPFVRHLGEEPFHVERERLVKRNSDDIVSRFENPDEVLAYLDGIGKPEWREERAVVDETAKS